MDRQHCSGNDDRTNGHIYCQWCGVLDADNVFLEILPPNQVLNCSKPTHRDGKANYRFALPKTHALVAKPPQTHALIALSAPPLVLHDIAHVGRLAQAVVTDDAGGGLAELRDLLGRENSSPGWRVAGEREGSTAVMAFGQAKVVEGFARA